MASYPFLLFFLFSFTPFSLQQRKEKIKLGNSTVEDYNALISMLGSLKASKKKCGNAIFKLRISSPLVPAPFTSLPSRPSYSSKERATSAYLFEADVRKIRIGECYKKRSEKRTTALCYGVGISYLPPSRHLRQRIVFRNRLCDSVPRRGEEFRKELPGCQNYWRSDRCRIEVQWSSPGALSSRNYAGTEVCGLNQLDFEEVFFTNSRRARVEVAT